MASPSKLRLVESGDPGIASGPDTQPHKASRVVLPSDATAEDAYRATLLNCAEHIASNVEAIAEARNHEGVHQARVGMRRLRVAVTSFGDAFETDTPKELSNRAKILARSFSVTRELDVFATDMLPPVEDALPSLGGLRELKLALEDVRAHAWTESVALVRSPPFEEFLLLLRNYAESRAWRDNADADRRAGFIAPAVKCGCDTLDERLDRARKRARHLDELDEKERHKLRISLKKLRYSSEFFAPLFKPKRVNKFVEKLSDLQDAFGDMNDAATVDGVLDRITGNAPESIDRAPLREASSFVYGFYRARVEHTWEKARKRWRKFEDATPFWHD